MLAVEFVQQDENFYWHPKTGNEVSFPIALQFFILNSIEHITQLKSTDFLDLNSFTNIWHINTYTTLDKNDYHCAG